MKIFKTGVLLLGLARSVFAIDDTPENRAKMADAYLQAVPAKSLMSDFVDKMAVQVPEANRETFKTAMLNRFDYAVLTRAERDALTQVFTADELAAMSNFYGSDTGRSIMKKFGSYMADVMPTVTAEVQRAMKSAMEQDTPKAATPGQ